MSRVALSLFYRHSRFSSLLRVKSLHRVIIISLVGFLLLFFVLVVATIFLYSPVAWTLGLALFSRSFPIPSLSFDPHSLVFVGNTLREIILMVL